MVEKEKLLPVRMQVVNKTGGGAAVAAAYLAEKKGDPNTIGFFTGVWLTSPLTSAEARVSLKDLTPVVRLVLEPAVMLSLALLILLIPFFTKVNAWRLRALDS